MALLNRSKTNVAKGPPSVTIRPPSGWISLGLQELWEYRELFYFMVWRDIKARYAQSVLGVGWAIIQPFVLMIIFTLVFGGLAKMASDGVPYAVFSYTALVPWTYFSTAVTGATESLTMQSRMFSKVYYPRLVIPFTSVLAKLLDFSVAMILVFGMMAWFRIVPTVWVLMLPALIVLMIISASGLGMWLTAMAVQYRDVKYGMAFGVRALMYLAPVVYPTSAVPEQLRLIYAVNPMVGVIEGFRSVLLNTTPIPWDLLIVGTISGVVLAVSGAFYFRRKEVIFADVV